MIFFGNRINKEQIIEALKKFDKSFPTNSYDSWLKKRTYKYAIKHNDKLYPPKYILSIASGLDTPTFSGGTITNRIFHGLGFTIVNKTTETLI